MFELILISQLHPYKNYRGGKNGQNTDFFETKLRGKEKKKRNRTSSLGVLKNISV